MTGLFNGDGGCVGSCGFLAQVQLKLSRVGRQPHSSGINSRWDPILPGVLFRWNMYTHTVLKLIVENCVRRLHPINTFSTKLLIVTAVSPVVSVSTCHHGDQGSNPIAGKTFFTFIPNETKHYFLF